MENPSFKIYQFEDKGLAHYSYAILSEGEVALIDPSRDPNPYFEYALLHDARIIAVIETHPHADFVSSHQEIAITKDAIVYTSKLTGAEYNHTTFDDGDFFQLGKVTLHAINTPGHSPDSITVILKDETQTQIAAFTGDTLFIGDVGRPDLREDVGNTTASREELARAMYRSTREKIMKLPDSVLVYPSHGAGSLCGKGLSTANSSTIGAEKLSNNALKEMTEDAFVTYLTADQPFVPKYFGFDVMLNKAGAPAYRPALMAVPRATARLDSKALIIDTRSQKEFNAGHLPEAINLMDGLKFETWLGSIVGPDETYYLVAADEESLEKVVAKTAKIGYEANIAGIMVHSEAENATVTEPEADLTDFKANPDKYTILDIRNTGEVKTRKIFGSAVTIPLPELRERLREIPTDKPVMVHCAGGYRSAAGASILRQVLEDTPVFDLSEAITKY